MINKKFTLALLIAITCSSASAADLRGEFNKGMHKMGVRYETGDGVARNKRTARQWYEKAADRGHPIAELKVDENGLIMGLSEYSSAMVEASNRSDFDRTLGRPYWRFLPESNHQTISRACRDFQPERSSGIARVGAYSPVPKRLSR